MDNATVIAILVDLQRAGLQLPPGPALEHVLVEVASRPYASFDSVLFALCGLGRHSSLEPPRVPLPYDLPIFEMDDYERGSSEVYGEIAEHIAAICGGELPIQVLACSESTLTVLLDGVRYRFVYEYQDDWVDPTVFGDLTALLANRSSSLRLVYACSVFFALPIDKISLLDEVVRRHNSGSSLTAHHSVTHSPSPPERLELARRSAW